MKLLTLIALLLPVIFMAGVSLALIDLYTQVGRLNGVRVTAGEGNTMVCKNVTQKIYYCRPIYMETSEHVGR